MQTKILVTPARRTAAYNVRSAWDVLLRTMTSPHHILQSAALCRARKEVNAEIARVSRNRPYFSGDGRIALIRVSSGAQVHPVIATRWSSSLKSKSLEVVMCANNGYLPGMTNFSCRVAKCARERRVYLNISEVNIIEILKEYADREEGLSELMGDDFARGHKQVRLSRSVKQKRVLTASVTALRRRVGA